MKYRIITNGEKYRIQRNRLWMFWITATEPMEFGSRYINFDTKTEAQQWINKQGVSDKWWPVSDGEMFRPDPPKKSVEGRDG